MRGSLVCLFLLVFACSGCAAITAAISETCLQGTLDAAYRETEQEKTDRRELERYCEIYAFPGRTQSEVETAARRAFHLEHGREPNLNWHIRENYPSQVTVKPTCDDDYSIEIESWRDAMIED
ncbi:hypothetical protein [Thalassoroseus pseudoceratinae]|uniref:hypothetical protein n=1 Tax=Thalassoroseus pseudoceratinae TaxID=2713176 RepID=UPI00141F24C1|nr:hypothetical protein [Thalassoroseus pseudoceratinae]